MLDPSKDDHQLAESLADFFVRITDEFIPLTGLEVPTTYFPILHVAEMWKRGHNNLIQDALAFVPFR